MPTYEYRCESCGAAFERQQPITEAPLTQCPTCGGKVERLVSGGAGFMFKDGGAGRTGAGQQACSLETTGRTCCGLTERCGKPSCGS